MAYEFTWNVVTIPTLLITDFYYYYFMLINSDGTRWYGLVIRKWSGCEIGTSEGTQEIFALRRCCFFLLIYWHRDLLPLGGSVEHRLYCLPTFTHLSSDTVQLGSVYLFAYAVFSTWISHHCQPLAGAAVLAVGIYCKSLNEDVKSRSVSTSLCVTASAEVSLVWLSEAASLLSMS